MLLAVATMSPGWHFVFFLIALILFVLAGIGVAVRRVSLIALGLAFFTVPFMWDALAAS